MTRRVKLVLVFAATVWTPLAAGAATVTLVKDTWQDGDRTTPTAPVYSEFGIDSDGDSDLESAWFNGGVGSVMTTTPGNLRLDPADAPATWTTYFAPDAAGFGVSLNDWIRVTWRYRTGDVSANDSNQNFRIAVVDSSPAAHLTSDGSPPAGVYAGLALFGNMAETTGNANSFQLRARDTPPAGALLEDTAAWLPVGNGLGAGAVGYADDTEYTFTMMLKRNTSNDLEITVSMAGGNLGGTGTVSLALTQTDPISFGYDTFSIYVADQSSTATLFDTSLFMVERGHDEPDVPEPASAVLVMLAALATQAHIRRRKSRARPSRA